MGNKLGSSDEVAPELEHPTCADRPAPGLKWFVINGEDDVLSIEWSGSGR